MVPTLAPESSVSSPPVGGRPDRRVASALVIDSLLFDPAGRWFCIDEHNVALPGAFPDLQAGLARVRAGVAAAVVGTLRTGVRVVDVDVDDERADLIASTIASWALQRGLWCMRRASGGGEWREHVILAGSRADEVDEVLPRLRSEHALPARAVDGRASGAVRPLSSPHRTGGWSLPPGDLTAAANDLRLALADVPLRSRRRDGVPPAAARRRRILAPTSEPIATIPHPRPHRPLPDDWARYLASGEAPPLGGHDRSSSTYTLVLTGHAIRAGWSHHETWQAIATAHPAACEHARARHRGRRWWTRHVWNPGVEQLDADWTPPRLGLDPTLEAAVAAAWGAAWASAAHAPLRQRATLLRVADVVLTRMLREGVTRVPVPERDVHEDTGLARTTIRAALTRLEDAGVLSIHRDTLDRAPRARAHSSYEASLPPLGDRPTQHLTGEGVRHILPPGFHTPLPPGGWQLLSNPSHRLHHALTQHPGSTAEDLAPLGLVGDPTASPSALRTVTRALLELGRVGLAEVDVLGRWSARETPTAQLLARAAQVRSALSQDVATDRAAYRRCTDAQWQAQRASAIEQTRERQRRWWDALSPRQRAARRRQWEDRYRACSIDEQARVKHDLARQRANRGENELARHDGWHGQWSDEEWLARSIERAAWYQALPPPERVAYARMWHTHRHAWNLPRGISRSTAANMRPTSEHRDQDFLTAQTQVNEITAAVGGVA